MLKMNLLKQIQRHSNKKYYRLPMFLGIQRKMTDLSCWVDQQHLKTRCVMLKKKGNLKNNELGVDRNAHKQFCFSKICSYQCRLINRVYSNTDCAFPLYTFVLNGNHYRSHPYIEPSESVFMSDTILLILIESNVRERTLPCTT